jgi:DnaK suppressor protein
MTLTKTQLAKLKDTIQAERERVLNSSGIDQEMFSLKSEEQKDEVDSASADYERSQMLRFKNRNAFYAKKLAGALEKMATEEYGICEECDEGISFRRLLARPTAQLCISCKDDAEREESNNFISRQSKTLEKQVEMVK